VEPQPHDTASRADPRTIVDVACAASNEIWVLNLQYRFDGATGRATPNAVPFVAAALGRFIRSNRIRADSPQLAAIPSE